jgi:hypothetical protein
VDAGMTSPTQNSPTSVQVRGFEISNLFKKYKYVSINMSDTNKAIELEKELREKGECTEMEIVKIVDEVVKTIYTPPPVEEALDSVKKEK